MTTWHPRYAVALDLVLMAVGSPSLGPRTRAIAGVRRRPLFAQDPGPHLRLVQRPDAADSIRTAIKAGAEDATPRRGSRAPTFRAKAVPPTASRTARTSSAVSAGSRACAAIRPAGSALWFRENGHAFDWGALKWCQLYATAPNGCFDVENITLDELGHVLILDHHDNYADESDYADSVVQTVSHAKPKAGWNAQRFGPCDIAQLQRQYDVLTTTKISTCLDIPTAWDADAQRDVGPWDGTVRSRPTSRS